MFEKPEKKTPANNQQGLEYVAPLAQPTSMNEPKQTDWTSTRRLSRLEGQYLVMQSQMIGMQSSLDRILGAIQASPATTAAPSFPAQYSATTPTQSAFYTPAPSDDRVPSIREPPPKFPPLPGFAPPPHKFATYGIVPSTAPSSDDESEETLPRASLNAPIEALQGLANAAAEAAAAPLSHNR